MGGETKILKSGGKLGQGAGALKWGEGLEPPYELWYVCMCLCMYVL